MLNYMLNILKKIIIFFSIFLFSNLAYGQGFQDQENQNLIRQQDWLTRQQQNKIDYDKQKQDQEIATKKYKISDLDWENTQYSSNKNNGDHCFTLQKITILNSKIFKKSDQDKINIQFLGKCFDKKLADEIISKIQTWYRNKGFIGVQVFIPMQNINNKELIIKIQEGSISQLIINDNKLSDRLQKFSAFGFIENKTLNIKDINQGLLQINRLASNNATLKIEPSSKEGQAKIIIKNIKKRPVRLSLGHDNLGSEFTGVKRTNLSLGLDNLLSFNDNLNLTYTKNLNDNSDKKDLRIYSLNFSIPYTYNNFSYDFSRSEFLGTINGNSSAIRISGFSNRHSFNLERLIFADEKLRLALFSNFTVKNSASYLNDFKIESSQRKLSIINLGFNYNYNFNNKFNLYVKPTLIKGIGVLNATSNNGNSSSALPQSNFEAIKLYVNLSQKINIPNFKNPVIISSEIDSQYSRHTLYGSEQFSVGGYYSVRGFRENYLIGDHGYFIRNKLVINVGDLLGSTIVNNSKLNLTQLNNLKLEPFFDYGAVRNRYNSQGGRLSGTGIRAIFNSKNLNSTLTYSRGLNKSMRFNTTKKEEQILLFEVSLGI